ncbi:hypothetical protein LSAT2_030039 [Lamellibrachia satsuma]|nr:hypothetical protein LSAT2_030039 [Lamellibrachia satsuma]
MCLPLVAETLLYCRPPLALCSGHARSRRRQNPLYESHGSDSPTPAKSKGLQGRQCPCAVTVVIALLAIVAFIMALLVITGTTTSRAYLVSQNHKNELAKTLARIKAMENDYAALLSKFDDIQTNLTKEIEYNKNVSSVLEGATKQLHLLHSNSTWQQDMFSELNTKQQIPAAGYTDPVKKPVGKFEREVEAMHNLPSGVDQLHKDVVKHTQKLAIVERKFRSLADNITSQMSMVSKMQEWVVMGVECTTDCGTGSYLNTTRVNDWNGLQYHCVCFGKREDISRYCELHIWQCPRLS